jgi:hypothetical protein
MSTAWLIVIGVVLTDATKPFRFAERDGVYEQRFTDFNGARST